MISGLNAQALRVCWQFLREGSGILYTDNVARIRVLLKKRTCQRVSVLGIELLLSVLRDSIYKEEELKRAELCSFMGRFEKICVSLHLSSKNEPYLAYYVTTDLSVFCEWLSSVPDFSQKRLEIEVDDDIYRQFSGPLETMRMLRGDHITVKELPQAVCKRWSQSFVESTTSRPIHRSSFKIEYMFYDLLPFRLTEQESSDVIEQQRANLLHSDTDRMRALLLGLRDIVKVRYSKDGSNSALMGIIKPAEREEIQVHFARNLTIVANVVSERILSQLGFDKECLKPVGRTNLPLRELVGDASILGQLSIVFHLNNKAY